MANILRIKRRLSGAAGAPSTANAGELSWNKVDGKLYIGDGVENSVLAGPGHFATLTQLASETSAREAAITSVSSNLSSEVTRATAAEQALGVRIDNVLSNTTQGSLDSLTEVVAAFEAADSNLNGAITSLANSASSALSSAVATLEAADDTLQSNIDSEASTRASAISGLDSRVVALESASADSRLDEVESDIEAIESAATALTGRVSSLETTAAGLGTMSTQNANNVAITGGSIEGINFDGGSF
jgi:prefoldin subunit 5